MQNVQSNEVRKQPGVRPGVEIGEVGAFERAETEYLRTAPLNEVEERLTGLQGAIERIARKVANRRAKVEAERCGHCGKGFTQKIPNGDGVMPYGGEKLHRPGMDTIDIYACSPSCLAHIQHDIEHNRLALLRENELRYQQAQEEMAAKGLGAKKAE